ncbi:MAG: Rieske (2Fe-2S) protein, partial [Halobacteriovoraceae bacterium]|nr:Rieske (2Fe-2S) protein [Halobacteriovoraceae bacterium]
MKSIRELSSDGWFAVSDTNIKPNEIKRVVLFEVPLIILKDSNKNISTFIDACPHRGYPLSEGTILNKKNLMCIYHGWCFNKRGECTALPGLDNIPRFKLKEVRTEIFDDMIWVSQSSNKEFDITHKRPELNKSFSWEYKLDVPGYLLIENTLDPMHTPFIHAGLVRSETKIKKSVDIVINNNEKFVEAIYKNEGEQSGLISKLLSSPNI